MFSSFSPNLVRPNRPLRQPSSNPVTPCASPTQTPVAQPFVSPVRPAAAGAIGNGKSLPSHGKWSTRYCSVIHKNKQTDKKHFKKGAYQYEYHVYLTRPPLMPYFFTGHGNSPINKDTSVVCNFVVTDRLCCVEIKVLCN